MTRLIRTLYFGLVGSIAIIAVGIYGLGHYRLFGSFVILIGAVALISMIISLNRMRPQQENQREVRVATHA